MIADLLGAAFMVAGAFFFLAGTIGLLRFPDTLTRLHAIAKADNLGLGLIVFGLVVRSGSIAVAAKLILIWMLALGGSAVASYLIARSQHGHPSGRIDG